MSDREIVIARRNGVVRGAEGERVAIRAGRTIADADHPIVALYPKVWAPVHVALRTDPGGPRPADNWDPAREGAQDTVYAEADPETVELAEQFRRLASLARGLGALADRPLTAAEVVDQLAAIVDEWQNGGHAQNDDGQAPEVGREEVRAWAKQAGIAVADKGRLAASVYAAYAEAH